MAAIPVEARSVLVLGGARSGKSAYAQALAEAAAPERVYLATAEMPTLCSKTSSTPSSRADSSITCSLMDAMRPT